MHRRAVTAEPEHSSDVGDEPFEPWPADAEIHVEWGSSGAALAADRGDVVVIVDVLSFSTSIVEITARGGSAIVLAPEQIAARGGRDAVADELGAVVVSRTRTTDELSLSPASLQSMPSGTRIVVTSLNGARCVAAAAAAPVTLVAALTNRAAAARRIDELLTEGVASRCTVVPCAETWTAAHPAAPAPTRTLRPSIEDQLGAGAVVASLPGRRRSVEAQVSVDVFRGRRGRLSAALHRTVSGRELIANGFALDVELAARLDVHDVVPERWPTSSPAEFAAPTGDAPR